MKKIQMVDLQSQYAGIAEELKIAFNEIIESAAFINGPYVKQFSTNLGKYLGGAHVVHCGNGTDALQIALMALDLEPGDEVIVPSFTFVASIEVVALLGFVPVLADVNVDTFNLDVNHVAELISDRTRVILPVHLFGQCCEMEAIKLLSEKHKLYLLEDNAQSIGAVHTMSDGTRNVAGTMGHIGTLSFYPSKNLGAYGDGGAVYTYDKNLAEIIQSIANHGSSRRYYHDRIGVNSRLDSLQAAVLDVKLKYLDKYIAARQNAARHYDGRLSQIEEIRIPARTAYSTHVFHQYTVRITDGRRDALKVYLQERDIPSMIYYPVPSEQQRAFESVVKVDSALAVTTQLCKEVLSLPMHSELGTDQLDYICDAVEAFFK